jgi:eukaryotic-like serine/threonine-protein kinase
MANHAVGQDTVVSQTLGHYRIIEKIGAGGMGEVYRARDEHLARDVAIKVLPLGTLTDESARKHFRKEALILSQLNHPNIATVHDFDTQQGVDFLVMEYIPGISLSEKVAAGPLLEKEVLRLGVQLAEGLAAAHDHGVVHRDLKPGNLRVTSDGRLKILDFGLAKLRLPVTASAATESLSETQGMAGTLPYMAPEQVLCGEIDARTDIHAAGSVLYEMATGQRPFADVERSQLIGAILRRSPAPPTVLNPKLSSELERIIGKCLEKVPENRYQSARELAIDLRRLQTGGLSVADHAASPARWWPAKSVGLGLGIVASLIVLLIAFNIGGWRERLLSQGDGLRIESLAVLPLKNLSGDPGQEYFADGMTDELITDLGNIGALRVISRTSAMQFKNSKKSLPEIAQVLNVDGVVEGSVLLAGDRVRINAHLVRAATDREIWTYRKERDLRDVIDLQHEVASAIARQIQVKLTQKEDAQLAGSRPVSTEVYEAYLKGRYYWNKRDRASLIKSLEYFQRAATKDPNYALAYSGMADVYVVLGSDWFVPSEKANAKGKAAAQKALEMDDSLAEAHTSLATIYHNEWNWQGAEREFKRAIDVNPNYATAHHWYSIYLATVARFDEAVQEATRAVELDPLSLIIHVNLGQRLNEARRYPEAAAQCRKSLDMDPNFGPAHFCVGYSSVKRGKFKEGIRELQKAIELFPGNPQYLGQLGIAYALSGETQRAREVLRKLKEPPQSNPYSISLVYAGLGEKEQAMAWLSKAYDQRSSDLTNLKIEPVLDSIRSNRLVQELMRRVGLPP